MRLFEVLSIGCLLIAATPVFASEVGYKSGYKGIFVGQSEAELPKTLNKGTFYSGVHNGDYFQVALLDAKVLYFKVIYIGETFDRTEIKKIITLAQALKEHSLSKSEKLSLAIARNRKGSIYGLVDLSGHITFNTLFSITSPDSRVTEVTYVGKSAPVLMVDPLDRLTEEQLSTMSSAANSATYSSPSVMMIDSSKRYTYSSREKAVRAITKQADYVIGRGKRTLALMGQAETLLELNENHPEAQETFRQLRKYHREFDYDYETLKLMYKFNKPLLLSSDLELFQEPVALSEIIERRMNQIVAMGFSIFSIND